MTTRSLHTAASEMAGLRESLRQARTDRPQLGRRPLVVLTEGRRRARFWHELQEDLGVLSSDSEWRVIDGAGHFIHHDRPEAVVAAINRVVEAARTEESQAISQAVGDPRLASGLPVEVPFALSPLSGPAGESSSDRPQ